MPTKKKRAFTKKNSVKFLLLHGNEKAQNADGETLENVLVPISKNYKPGSSLLMTRIAELVNESNPPGVSTAEADIEKILGQFDDVSDSEDEGFKNIQKELKNLHVDGHVKSIGHGNIIVEEEFEDDGDFPENCSDFSDADSDFSNTPADEFSFRKPDCPESLKILEERMEKKLEEYEDDQLGALDEEEICGYLTGESERVNQFIESCLTKDEELVEIGKCEESLKAKILKLSEEETPEHIVEIITEKPLEHDCESIISTYSNKYNHPVLIKEEGKIKKIRVSANPLQKHLTKSKLKQLDSETDSEDNSEDDKFSIASTVNTRPKGETPEQRRERKNLFKEAKRESRMLKKENKLAFKNEKKLQKAQAMNIQNTRGIRLH